MGKTWKARDKYGDYYDTKRAKKSETKYRKRRHSREIQDNEEQDSGSRKGHDKDND